MGLCDSVTVATHIHISSILSSHPLGMYLVLIKPNVTVILIFGSGYVLRWTIPPDQAGQVDAFQITTYRLLGGNKQLVSQREVGGVVRAYAVHHLKPDQKYLSEVRVKVEGEYGPLGIVEKKM